MAEKSTMVAERRHLEPNGKLVDRGELFEVTAGQEREYERAPHLAVPKIGRARAAAAGEPTTPARAAPPVAEEEAEGGADRTPAAPAVSPTKLRGPAPQPANRASKSGGRKKKT